MVSKFLWGVRFIRAPETPTTAIKKHHHNTSSNSDKASDEANTIGKRESKARTFEFFGGYGLFGPGGTVY